MRVLASRDPVAIRWGNSDADLGKPGLRKRWTMIPVLYLLSL